MPAMAPPLWPADGQGRAVVVVVVVDASSSTRVRQAATSKEWRNFSDSRAGRNKQVGVHCIQFVFWRLSSRTHSGGCCGRCSCCCCCCRCRLLSGFGLGMGCCCCWWFEIRDVTISQKGMRINSRNITRQISLLIRNCVNNALILCRCSQHPIRDRWVVLTNLLADFIKKKQSRVLRDEKNVKGKKAGKYLLHCDSVNTLRALCLVRL